MEFAQRLTEAAKLASETRKDDKRFFLYVAEEGIGIRAIEHKDDGRSLTKIVSYKEIEQCRINPLTVTIKRMIEELSAPVAESS